MFDRAQFGTMTALEVLAGLASDLKEIEESRRA
jgi:hypothetical protein